jgi:TolA-binding protein
VRFDLEVVMRKLLTVAVAALFLAPVVLQAQSMGEAAARERERRKGKEPGKVITAEELRRAGAGKALLSGDAGSAPAEAQAKPAAETGAEKAGEKKEKTEEELREEEANAWRDKVKETNDEITRLNGEVAELQTALNDLSQQIYGSGRTKQINQLEAAKAKLAAAEQKAAELQEEGRRKRFR